MTIFRFKSPFNRNNKFTELEIDPVTKRKLIKDEENVLTSSATDRCKIETMNFDIIVKPSSNDNISYKVFLEKGKEEDIKISANELNRTFTITIKEKRSNQIGGVLIIEVPSLFGLIINTTNGDIGGKVLTAKEIDFKTTNGNITVNSSSFNSANIKTTNGNITVKTIRDIYSIYADTTNGDIDCRIKNDSQGKKINCITTNGDITII